MSGPIPVDELEAFLGRPAHGLRERVLWRMLYETAARAQEVLLLDVEDLDLANRRATVIGKGGDAELIGWETATARLLPRYLAKRPSGPLFLAAEPPVPGPAVRSCRPDGSAPVARPGRLEQVQDVDVDVASSRGRLGHSGAARLFSVATGGRWTMHQLRHTRLTALMGSRARSATERRPDRSPGDASEHARGPADPEGPDTR